MRNCFHNWSSWNKVTPRPYHWGRRHSTYAPIVRFDCIYGESLQEGRTLIIDPHGYRMLCRWLRFVGRVFDQPPIRFGRRGRLSEQPIAPYHNVRQSTLNTYSSYLVQSTGPWVLVTPYLSSIVSSWCSPIWCNTLIAWTDIVPSIAYKGITMFPYFVRSHVPYRGIQQHSTAMISLNHWGLAYFLSHLHSKAWSLDREILSSSWHQHGYPSNCSRCWQVYRMTCERASYRSIGSTLFEHPHPRSYSWRWGWEALNWCHSGGLFIGNVSMLPHPIESSGEIQPVIRISYQLLRHLSVTWSWLNLGWPSHTTSWPHQVPHHGSISEFVSY